MRDRMSARRGQVMSVDLLIALIIFISVVAVIIVVLSAMSSRENRTQFEYELLYVYENLDKNLEADAPAGTAFYHAYRVDADRLNAFATTVAPSAPDIDGYLLSNGSRSEGVGLIPEGYDTCLYLTDNNGSRIPFGALDALGTTNSGSCSDLIAAGNNPCKGYAQVMSIFRPVLYDEHAYERSRIVQLNVMLCKV